MKRSAYKILAIMQLPPPVHGQSIMNQIIHQSELINNSFDLTIIPLHFAKLDNLGKANISKFFKMIYYAYVLIKKILHSNPDLVYFTLSPVGFAFYRDCLYVIIIKALKVPVVYHLHGKGIKGKTKNKFIKLIYSYVFKNSSVILLSKYLKPDLDGVIGNSTKVFYLPNGIKDKIPLPFVGGNQKSSDGIPTLLFLSNIIKTKGIFIFLKALSYIKKKGIPIRVLLVGGIASSVPENVLYRAINDYGLSDNVKFLGPKYGKDKDKILMHSDVFVFPTYKEAFPLVILEAMRAGLPIISTFEGAIPEMVENGTNGFLVPQKNASQLAERIETLIEDKNLRVEFGQKSQEKFKKFYTESVFESNLVQILEKICNF